MKTPMQEWLEQEHAAQAKALQLMDGYHPAANMKPTVDLVKAAWAMGYDIIRRPPTVTD